MGKLTALKIKTLTKPGYYSDGNGLYLQVQSAAARSWVFRFKRDKRAREMGLGKFETGLGDGLGLADARDAAIECRKLLRIGVDPIDARRTQRAADRLAAAGPAERSFDTIAERYIASQEAAWDNPSTAKNWRATLKTYATPALGAKDVASVVTEDLVAILKPIWLAKPNLASRLRGRIESILDYARVEGWRAGENPARLRGHLVVLLPKQKSKALRVQHHPAMAWKEIPAFMAALWANQGRAARALELTILTAARGVEVRDVPRGEIDRKAAVWTVPNDRMKTRREHRVALSNAALATLARVWPTGEDPEAFVFPGTKRGKSISHMAMPNMLNALGGGDATVHGFRSSFRDWVSEATDYPGELAEAALSHVKESEVESAYNRSDLFEKRRKLMEDWGQFCASLRG